MGIYNTHSDKDKVPYIKDNICPLCKSEMIPQPGFAPEADAFDYKCKNCNPNVIISISGSLLASEEYEDIQTNSTLRQSLIKKVKSAKGKNVAITTQDFWQ